MPRLQYSIPLDAATVNEYSVGSSIAPNQMAVLDNYL